MVITGHNENQNRSTAMELLVNIIGGSGLKPVCEIPTCTSASIVVQNFFVVGFLTHIRTITVNIIQNKTLKETIKVA